MPASLLSAAEYLTRYCHKIYDKSLSPGTAGNVSIKQDDRIYITPSGCCLGELEPEEVITLNLDGEHIAGPGVPSSEWVIHHMLYRERPDINAVVHAHPTKAAALAACHKTLDKALIAEAVYHLGEVPLVPYILPGTRDLAEAIRAQAQQAQVMLLANHGVITLGKSLPQAYYHLELTESMAEVYILSHLIPGGPQPLSPKDVDALFALKAQSGA